MRKRTKEEIEAYADGYNACFNAFCDNLKHRKSVMDAVKKMEIMRAAVNGVVTRSDEDD